MYEIDKKYLVPIENISCPGCGRKYGHHNTKVDIISEECSSCVKERGNKIYNLTTAKDFIENHLDIKPLFG